MILRSEGGPFNVRSSSRNLTELLSKGRIFAQYFDLTAYTPFFLAWHFSSEKIAVFPMYSVLFLIFFSDFFLGKPWNYVFGKNEKSERHGT
jgi:hypothetical protein